MGAEKPAGWTGEMLPLVSVFQQKQVFRPSALLIDVQNPPEQTWGQPRREGAGSIGQRPAGQRADGALRTCTRRSHPIHVSVHPAGSGLPHRARPECVLWGPGSPGAQGGLERPPKASHPGQGLSLPQAVIKPWEPLLSHPRTRKRKAPAQGL